MSQPSPGEQWYAWFVAHTKQRHLHPAWEKLSHEQQALVQGFALRAREWACAPSGRDCTTIVWQFAQGDAVLLPSVGGRGIVRQQRVTVRDIFSPVREYLVEPDLGASDWYYEADLIAAEP